MAPGDHRVIIIAIVGACLGGIVTVSLVSFNFVSGSEIPTAPGLVGNVTAPKLLDEHTLWFTRNVYTPTKGIHVAVGFGVGNSILIEAPEGAIIIDTSEGPDPARDIYAAFRNITNAPIKAIIFTHHHPDHITGAQVFNESSRNIEVWAYKTLPQLLNGKTDAGPITERRSTYQFGQLLRDVAPSAFRNVGIGHYLRKSSTQAERVNPTNFLTDSTMNVVIAGLPMTLVHIPGEASDEMGIWIPSKGAFFSGDTMTKTFPNLYAIRGAPARDTTIWSTSLGIIRDYEPEYLIPSHGRPMSGRDNIKSTLTVFKDAIMFVHDQTVRYMNKGKYPDDIVALVKLPKHMAENPYLIPYYGTVEWSVRAVFDRYIGWFDGNIVELSRHTRVDRAERMVDLGGGRSNMIRAAEKAFDDLDYRWGLEVASYVLTTNPRNPEAQRIRTNCLKALASQQLSANGRNYYLTATLIDYDLVDIGYSESMKQSVSRANTPQKLFDTLSLRLKAEDVEGVNKTLVLFLSGDPSDPSDPSGQYTLYVFNSVLNVVNRGAGTWDIKVTVSFDNLKKVFLKEIRAGQGMKVEGGVRGIRAFEEFLNYFEIDE